MPSTLSFFRSNSNSQSRRSSNVSSDSARSAFAKSVISDTTTATPPTSAKENTGQDLETPRQQLPKGKKDSRLSSLPKLQQVLATTTPASTTSASTAVDTEPARSSSLPSIDITSPTTNQTRTLWDPLDPGAPSPRTDPREVFPSPVARQLQPASSPAEEDDEDHLFRISQPIPRKKMPRPNSSHSKFRSEPGGAPGGGGTPQKRKGDALDRHDIMRRAMAEATNSDAFGTQSSDMQIDSAAPSLSQRIPPSESAGSFIDHGDKAGTERIGEGSLNLEHFASAAKGDGEVVHADGTTSLSSATAPNMTASQDGHAAADDRRPSIVNNVPVTASPAETGFPTSAPSSASYFPAQGPANRHGRYATDGEAMERNPSQISSLAIPAPHGQPEAKHMHESYSTSNLLPSPLHRLRKLSDSGSAKNGIAGAIAASGMAGMGVGHRALLDQAQLAKSSTKQGGKSGSKSRQSSLGADPLGSYEGGVYRDPKTGLVIERGPEDELSEEYAQRQKFLRSRSATGSTLSLASSDVSGASGLNAAANFSAAQMGLLAPDYIARRKSTDGPLMTPGGIGAVGGLSPSGLGERVALGDDEAWPGDMGAQITGFAVASSKRNQDFHSLFTAVPEDDYLIEDYGCALVREILIQGRLYVSENHVCFYANIFGWVTNIVLPFSEIVSIEKRMTAYVIPNAIQIATLHSKQTFASFLSRDTTYDLIVNIWKLSHPGVPVGEIAPDLLTDEESVEHDAGRDGEGETEGKSKSDTGHDEAYQKKSRRKLLKKKLGIKESDQSGTAVGAGDPSTNGKTISRGKSPAPGGKKSPHRKTQCPCEGEKKHFSQIVLETTYPAVPEKIYNLIFTSGFMKDFWNDNQKLLDLQMSDWAPNKDNENMLSRNISYIKPLTGSFGPKQTKCLLTDENIHVDFDNYVIALTTTRTPDVPSGGSFSVKTKTCFTWAGGNVTKIYVTCQVDWTGRSMVKGIIDRASIDGQKQYYKDLDVAIRQYIKDHANEFREEGDDETADEAIAGQAGAGIESQAAKEKDTSGSTTLSVSGEGKEGFAKYLEMLGEAGRTAFDGMSDLLGSLSDMASGASPSVLILGFVVFLLLVSNLWALRSAPSRDPLDPHRLRDNGSGYSPSARRGASAKSAYRNHDEAESAHAVALAVREVLQDYFDPSSKQFMAGSRVQTGEGQSVRRASADPLQEIQNLLGLLDEVDGRVAKLREHLKIVSEGQSLL